MAGRGREPPSVISDCTLTLSNGASLRAPP
jgi:hypothetical protein